MERLGCKLEKHTMIKNFDKYNNNKLIKDIINVKEIGGQRLYYTIRTNSRNKECIGIYINGIVVYLILENGCIYLQPSNKQLPIEKIANIDMYKKNMKKIIDECEQYQNNENEMKEKVFQHNLIEDINDIKFFKKKYGKVTIIDEELFIFLTKYKKRENSKGRVDLVGVSEEGKLLFIEVKIDGSVILGKNGINKHCYDIGEYCKNAKYKKEDLNIWIKQLNDLFGRNIPYIKNDNPDFILLCGYNIEAKYDVIDQISEIISKDMINNIKNFPDIVQVIENDPSTIKTLAKHFDELKKNRPVLVLAEVKDNKVIKDFEVNRTRINYEDKPWHIIRTSLIRLTNGN